MYIYSYVIEIVEMEGHDEAQISVKFVTRLESPYRVPETVIVRMSACIDDDYT